MKKAILFVALVASVIVAGYSCNWFSSKSAKNPLIGSWNVDSVHTADSATVAGLLFSLSNKDSVSHHLEFTEDSVTVSAKDKVETSAYSLDKDKKQLTIGEAKDKLNYEFLADSSLQLTAQDSSVYVLLKK